MAHDKEARRIAAVLSDMVMHPVDGFGDVAHDGPHIHGWQEPIVGRDKDESFIQKKLRLDLHACLVATLPTAAVDPENYR
jgi:hypothetical protein